MIGLLMFIVLFGAVFGVCYLIYAIKNWYDRTFKKDCKKCKHFYLANVASFGDGCEFRCKKTGYRTIPMISINERHHYKKCDEFESEDK